MAQLHGVARRGVAWCNLAVAVTRVVSAVSQAFPAKITGIKWGLTVHSNKTGTSRAAGNNGGHDSEGAGSSMDGKIQATV